MCVICVMKSIPVVIICASGASPPPARAPPPFPYPSHEKNACLRLHFPMNTTREIVASEFVTGQGLCATPPINASEST